MKEETYDPWYHAAAKSLAVIIGIAILQTVLFLVHWALPLPLTIVLLLSAVIAGIKMRAFVIEKCANVKRTDVYNLVGACIVLSVLTVIGFLMGLKPVILIIGVLMLLPLVVALYSLMNISAKKLAIGTCKLD